MSIAKPGQVRSNGLPWLSQPTQSKSTAKAHLAGPWFPKYGAKRGLIWTLRILQVEFTWFIRQKLTKLCSYQTVGIDPALICNKCLNGYKYDFGLHMTIGPKKTKDNQDL